MAGRGLGRPPLRPAHPARVGVGQQQQRRRQGTQQGTQPAAQRSSMCTHLAHLGVGQAQVEGACVCSGRQARGRHQAECRWAARAGEGSGHPGPRAAQAQAAASQPGRRPPAASEQRKQRKRQRRPWKQRQQCAPPPPFFLASSACSADACLTAAPRRRSPCASAAAASSGCSDRKSYLGGWVGGGAGVSCAVSHAVAADSGRLQSATNAACAWLIPPCRHHRRLRLRLRRTHQRARCGSAPPLRRRSHCSVSCSCAQQATSARLGA